MIYEALDRDFVVRGMPGVEGALRLCHESRFPSPRLSGQQPVGPCRRGSRLSHVRGLGLGSAAAGLRTPQRPGLNSGSGRIALAMGPATAVAASADVPPFLLLIAYCRKNSKWPTILQICP